MSYNAQNPPLQALHIGMGMGVALSGFGPMPSSVWMYRSSDPSTAIAATGYFTGQGYGGRIGPNSSSPAPVGMRVGDLVICVESTLGASPGRVTMHSVTGSTADQASTSASTGYNAKYDVTVSSAATT